MNIGLKLLRAVQLDLESKIAKEDANLQVYLENPVGIGEHSDLVEEVSTMIDNISDAEDSLVVVTDKIHRLERNLDLNCQTGSKLRIPDNYPPNLEGFEGT